MCASKSPCHCQQHTPAEQEKIKTVLAALQRRPSVGKSLTSRTSTIGAQMSTIRLKEGYHHYRKSDSVVVEIGEEHYSKAEPFIYNAAYSQNDLDANGNMAKKSVMELGKEALENGMEKIGISHKGQRKSSVNKPIKPPSEKSSAHDQTSTTAKQLYNIFTCRRYVISIFT